MKRFQFYFVALAATVMSLSLTSCDGDDVANELEKQYEGLLTYDNYTMKVTVIEGGLSHSCYEALVEKLKSYSTTAENMQTSSAIYTAYFTTNVVSITDDISSVLNYYNQSDCDTYYVHYTMCNSKGEQLYENIWPSKYNSTSVEKAKYTITTTITQGTMGDNAYTSFSHSIGDCNVSYSMPKAVAEATYNTFSERIPDAIKNNIFLSSSATYNIHLELKDASSTVLNQHDWPEK